MSELKIRGGKNRPWESIETNRAIVRKTPSWGWAAHRGAFYSEMIPENTIPALIRAKELGFAYCECDTKVTSDGVVVVCHNDTITGLNAEGVSTTLTIAESTAAEFCALRMGPHKRFGYVNPCTLDDFMNTAYYIGIKVIIHSRSAGEDEGRKIAESVSRNGMFGRVIYLTTAAAITAIAAVDRQAHYEVLGSPSESGVASMKETVESLGLAYAGFDMTATTGDISATVELAKKAGFGVSFWNVTAENVANCLKYKPTAITLASDTADFHTWEKDYLDTVKLW